MHRDRVGRIGERQREAEIVVHGARGVAHLVRKIGEKTGGNKREKPPQKKVLLGVVPNAFVPDRGGAQTPIFRWGGDAEGGAPFVEADPNDPSKLRGFDVEVAEQIAKGLGRRPEFVQVSFSDIDQSVQRGDFDIGMSGVEDTPARRRMLAATIPYFEFHEVLTMRAEDRGKFSSLAALRGRRVGTLGGRSRTRACWRRRRRTA